MASTHTTSTKTAVRSIPKRLHDNAHAAARLHHARRHPATAPANVRHQDSLSLSEHLAMLLTSAVGTMVCAACFALLALVSLPAALATHDVVVIVAWVAQTFLQLVLLPVIMVGQNLQSRHSELRAEADFTVNQEALHHLVRQDEWILAILRHLDASASATSTTTAPHHEGHGHAIR